MPTYEYACKSCGEHLEVSQSFTDPALTTCGSCGGELRKVFGSIGIVLKGSGFYRNDSRGPAPAEAGASDSGSSDGSSSEAKAGSDRASAADASGAKSGSGSKAGDGAGSGSKGSGERSGSGSSTGSHGSSGSREAAAS